MLSIKKLHRQTEVICNSSLSQAWYLSQMAHLQMPANQSEIDFFLGGVLTALFDPSAVSLLHKVLKSTVVDILKRKYGNGLLNENLNKCGWNVTMYVNNSAKHINLNSSKPSDAVVLGTNLNGNFKIAPKTCTISFAAANDMEDIRALHTMTFDLGGPQQVDLIRGNFITLVSGLTHDLYKPSLQEYELFKNQDLLFTSWMSLANSSECNHLLLTGFSMGGMLAQIHRIDIGDVNDFGIYNSTCLGGKSCRLIGIKSFSSFWYGRVPEFDKCSDDRLLIIVENDPGHHILPLVHGLLKQSARDSLNISSFVDIRNIMVEWRFKNQYLEMNYFKPRVMSFFLPCEMSVIDFSQSSAYRDRHSYVNSWGPLVARPLCLGILGTSVSLSAKLCPHFNPLNLLFTASLFEEDHLDDFGQAWSFGLGIPDIDGTVFNALIR